VGGVSDFLLELRSEEIPARMQAGARADLERLFRAEMEAAGVSLGEVTVWSTPRRLALIARDLPAATEAVSEEAKGPPEGAPDAAVDGFCRKAGVTRDQLELREVKGRATYFAVIEKPGRATREVLAQAVPAIVRAFPWPKSMRWGAASLSSESLRWVRPLSGIVAILGEDLVECEVGGIASGYLTIGHRFHGPGPITIGGASDYREKLRACHVIVDHEERQDLIRAGAARAAAEAGLALVPDEGLVIENAGLTEWPVPLLGRFDAAFLDVPPEVIQLTARVNQKYFVCNPPRNGEGDHAKHGGGDLLQAQFSAESPLHRPADGPPPRAGEATRLANAFVCTANIDAEDGGAAIVDGNRKVLAARLSDARFFWEQDRKTPLAEHARKLERITFHEKLGTVADKVERVAKLARWLVEEGVVKPPRSGEGDHAQHGGGDSAASAAHDAESPPSPATPAPPPPAGEDRARLADLAEQAARLAKADLVTEMVGEFPELQGLMGGYYARAEGLPDAVADAIRDHYKPVGQGDEVPTAPVTVAVSLADKLDTIAGFFLIGEKPTGSKDPFALRRAMLSVNSLIQTNSVSVSFRDLVAEALKPFFWLRWLKAIGSKPFNGQTPEESYRFLLSQRKPVAFSFADSKNFKIEIGSGLLAMSHGTKDNALSVSPAPGEAGDEVLQFAVDRLKVQQREAGVRHDLIDAVFALGGEDDLVRLLARVKALQSFMATEDGANLLAGYKRAANILKKEDWRGPDDGSWGEIARTGEEDPLALVDDPDLAPVIKAKMAERKKNALSYTPEPAEEALIAALDAAEPRAQQAVAAEDFGAAMAALASLRAAVDRFFDEVTVNDSDPAKRAARLDLLLRFRDAVHQVADFSRIEG
jgi:glycyl-tRNA synthetase beta chain